MSYTPTTWQTGDTITAEKLNKMEQGIEEMNKSGQGIVMRWSDVEGCWVVDRVESISVFGTLVGFEEVQEGQEPVITYLERAEENGYLQLSFISSVDYSNQSIVHRSNRIFTYTIQAGKLVAGSSVGERGPLIVYLTPTAQDFSGVMDKTVAEIYEAYTAGRGIVFHIIISDTEYMEVDCTARYVNGGGYPSFNGFIIINSPMDALIYAGTGTAYDGTQNTYFTTIYPLTPMT